MDDLRIGAVIRTLPLRTRRTQGQLGAAPGVSQLAISRFERGNRDSASLELIRRVFRALDARIDLVPRWRGGELDRLVDARHAGMTEALVRRLATLPDWIVQPEVTFSIYRERGSIDVIAWHPGRRAILIIEVKSGLDDIGGLTRQVDRYRRLARQIAHERGWTPVAVAVWVVIADGGTARRRLAEHRMTLRRAFSADGHTMERWLHSPTGDVAGLSFLPFGHPAISGRRPAAPRGKR